MIVVLAADVLPPDAKTRLTDFTHLVASSISNVQARNSLIASRARIVTASDETRRRIARNLHDAIQQRVVSVGSRWTVRPVRAPRSASSCPCTPRPSTSVRTSELSPGHGPGDRPEQGSPWRCWRGISDRHPGSTLCADSERSQPVVRKRNCRACEARIHLVEVACRAACVVQAPSGFEVMPAR